jgi:hypothetical protein
MLTIMCVVSTEADKILETDRTENTVVCQVIAYCLLYAGWFTAESYHHR